MIINDKEYKLELSGYTLIVYKEKFHKDLLTSIADLEKGVDVVSLMEFVWALAKSCDSSVPNFDEFAKSITDIGSFVSKETIEELTDVVRNSSQRTIEPKKA